MSALGAAMKTLSADAVAAESAGAMREAGIPVLLLKGPAIAHCVYGDASERDYVDVDLLVHPDRMRDAEATLAALGFESDHSGLGPAELDALLALDDVAEHAVAWRRAGTPASIDLHETYPGVGADHATLWSELSSGAARIRVAGEELAIPGRAACALIAGLHSAWHGAANPKPLRDLERAVARLPLDVWEDAVRLAARLEATPALSAGLRLLPAGTELAERLSLPRAVGVETALRAQSLPPTALGFQRIAEVPGPRAKLARLAREVVPTRVFMRHSSPLARRGRIGLAAAYVRRPFWIAAHARRGFIVWRRARKEEAT